MLSAPRTRPHLFIPSLPTLDPALLAPTLAPPRPRRYPLDLIGTRSVQLFYLARAAVFHAVGRFVAGARKTVLMPAYHHGVEVEAVRATGARVAWYRVDRDMRIDLDDLTRRAAAADVAVVYVTHFVGFAQPIAEVAALCRARELRLFEDCALALFARAPDGRELGATGDAACFCLYKSLPVPHGGILRLGGGASGPVDTVTPPLLSTLHHVAGLTLAHLELRSAGLGRAVRSAARAASHATVDKAVETVRTGTMHLEPHELGLGASRLVERLLPRFDAEMVVVRRRRNFARLAEALGDVVEVIGAPLAPGACPLFLPIRVTRKRALMQALHAHGIDAVDFWSRGAPDCDDDEFPEVAALRREVLELPCHQSLDDEAVDRVAHTVKRLLAHA